MIAISCRRGKHLYFNSNTLALDVTHDQLCNTRSKSIDWPRDWADEDGAPIFKMKHINNRHLEDNA